MAYGTDTHTDYAVYELTLTHSVGADLFARVSISGTGGASLTEAQRDALFQAFLTILAGIGGTTSLTAQKRGTYAATVTP